MITFEHIKTGEKVNFDGTMDPLTRQAQMAAYLNSSDMSPNAGMGQDFGWRLSPEIIAQMTAARSDVEILGEISRRLGIDIEDIQDFHILNKIADEDFASDALQARLLEDESSNKADYEKRVEQAKMKMLKSNKEKKNG